MTTARVTVEPSRLDFGDVSVHEQAACTIHITNHAALPQQFGFVDLPAELDVQPDDGFGTLLPFETIEREVLFAPQAATAHKLTLNLKAWLSCVCVRVCVCVCVVRVMVVSRVPPHPSCDSPIRWSIPHPWLADGRAQPHSHQVSREGLPPAASLLGVVGPLCRHRGGRDRHLVRLPREHLQAPAPL